MSCRQRSPGGSSRTRGSSGEGGTEERDVWEGKVQGSEYITLNLVLVNSAIHRCSPPTMEVNTGGSCFSE